MKYVIIGSHLDGNKGAASMLEAAMQTLLQADPDAEFTLLSMYPEGDQRINEHSRLQVLRANPVYLGLVINSLALLYRLLPPLRSLLRRNRQIGAIAQADVFLDQGGITFVDGREVFLLYNIASILPALLVGTPVVKCSQAMGPFEGRLNRICAKVFLPRVKRILARGAITEQFLEKMNLDNVLPVADYAFCLEVSDREAAAALSGLEAARHDDGELNIGVFPSEVMRKKLANKGFDYEGFMADLIDRVIERHGAVVYLVPHSLKNSNKRHNNDIPLCDDIYARVKAQDMCRYLRSISSAQQLRYVIGKLDAAVVARFHAMVSALSMATPVFVTGWSHKYQEVLDMFALQDCSLKESELSLDAVLSGVDRMLVERERIKSLIKEHLPQVKSSAGRHVDIIIEVARENQRSCLS